MEERIRAQTAKKSILSVPNSTYRIQFWRDFPISRALELGLPDYLKQLGVAYCYSSPLLKSRSGSTHGYDVVDHILLNPEIASNAQFDEFSRQLKQNGLGLLLDIVPNHVGISSPYSRWWMDVLENGKGSIFSDHFDIKWETHQNRILVPFLGNPLGTILNNGELKVQWNEKEEMAAAEGKTLGSIQLHYYGAHFPIDPATFAHFVLEPAVSSAGSAAFQAIVSQFTALPNRDTIGELNDDHAAKRKQRRDKAQELKAALSKLIAEDASVKKAVQGALDSINDKKNLDKLTNLVLSQPYRLCYWKMASDELNYRRFFDINELLAIKAEKKEVFEESLQLVSEWVKLGKVDALRLDHPDGLFDPVKFFEDLQGHMVKNFPAGFETIDPRPNRPFYVLVEKILEPGETLRTDWAVSGTVGYEYLNLVNDIFVNTEKEAAARKAYLEFVRNTPAKKIATDFHGLLYDSKKLIIAASFDTELQLLTRLLHGIASRDLRFIDFSARQLKAAIGEFVACFPVYRTYITQSVGPSAEDLKRVEEATKAVRQHDQVDSLIVDLIDEILTCRDEAKVQADLKTQRRHFVMKFQQVTGPIMAKGLEDTSFYRYFLLTSLNEVGGDPNCFGVTLEAFHKYNLERAKHWPQSMSNSSTHDTKRSEDVRARINVISEMPEVFYRAVCNWRDHNEKHKTHVEHIGLVPEANEEYMIYQTLVGAWPLGAPQADASFIDRLKAYFTKAMKESKLRTTWTKQNKSYEDGVLGFVEKILKDQEFVSQFLLFAEEIFRLGKSNSVSQVIVKLTCPGVPDVYQGQELWDFSLVDPDNRRPVDFDTRKSLLASVTTAANGTDLASFAVRALEDADHSGLIKMLATQRLLALRNAHPALFLCGDYFPITAKGTRANHVIAFSRSLGEAQVIVATVRFFALGSMVGAALWQGGELAWPGSGKKGGRFRDVLTNTVHELDADRIPLSVLFKHLPFAVLERLV